MTSFLPDSRPRLLVALGLMLVLGACAAPQQTPSTTAPAGGATTSAPSSAAGSPGAPPPASGSAAPSSSQATPAPAVDPAIARPQAQKLALEAEVQLQNGDEPAARGTLERAIALDSTNELARKLQEQIRADAQKELGPVFFRYTVQRDDTLSKLAQQYLGDRFRFYLLAKYNDITNPSRLAAGQVIKLPGKGPLPSTTPPVAEIPVAPAKPEPPVAKPRDDVADMLARASELEKGGNLEGAYAAYSEVLQRSPGNTDATKRRDSIRTGLVRTYDREATQAFQRQNLDLAIEKWDRVLELDPANRKARLERDRAADLKKRMQAKFGGKEAAK